MLDVLDNGPVVTVQHLPPPGRSRDNSGFVLPHPWPIRPMFINLFLFERFVASSSLKQIRNSIHTIRRVLTFSHICLSVCLSVCVCLSASISLEPLDRSSRNFVCRSSVAVVRSSSGGLAMRYVFPVLWMTSRLVVVGRMAIRGG